MDLPKIERMLRLMKMMSGNLNYTVSQEEAYLVNSLIDRLDPTNALKADLKRKHESGNSHTVRDQVKDSGKDYRAPRAKVVEVGVQGMLCQSLGNAPMREYDYGNGGFDEK